MESDKPVVPVTVAWDQSVQTPYFILDTGFTGDLVVTESVAKDLGLDITAVTNVRVANGEIRPMKTATAIAAMEGKQLYVTVFVTEGWPLMGISFMEKFSYCAEIDCKNKTVRLEAVT